MSNLPHLTTESAEGVPQAFLDWAQACFVLLHSENIALQNQISELKISNDVLKTTYDGLKAENKTLQDSYDSISAKLVALEADFKEILLVKNPTEFNMNFTTPHTTLPKLPQRPDSVSHAAPKLPERPSRKSILRPTVGSLPESERQKLQDFERRVQTKIVKGSWNGNTLIKESWIISGEVSEKLPILDQINISGIIGCRFEKLSPFDFDPIAASLMYSGSQLAYLNLDSNNLGDYGANIIASALPLSSLKILRLFDNSIGPQGVSSISNAIRNNDSTLQILDLEGNKIGAEGAKALASMLLHNTTLKYLNVSFNHLHNKGAIEMASALNQNSNLIAIYLSDNKIGDEGASFVASALTQNKSLLYLNISLNVISESVKSDLGNIRGSLVVDY
ncbi:hypothetical protein HK096_008736 [Nowakowskiella sp. JEL0078]|nr:hypothetical protein HK096_008736 [Nowakowskiella sp. JEL0078]